MRDARCTLKFAPFAADFQGHEQDLGLLTDQIDHQGLQLANPRLENIGVESNPEVLHTYPQSHHLTFWVFSCNVEVGELRYFTSEQLSLEYQKRPIPSLLGVETFS